jgi:hypothetical protein
VERVCYSMINNYYIVEVPRMILFRFLRKKRNKLECQCQINDAKYLTLSICKRIQQMYPFANVNFFYRDNKTHKNFQPSFSYYIIERYVLQIQTFYFYQEK